PTGEQVRPEDGALVRRRSRSTYDVANQLEHTEDVYEVIREGQVIASEHHSNSPDVRWYRQEQAVNLYRQAGFTDIRLVSGFTRSRQPASEGDSLFSILGTRP